MKFFCVRNQIVRSFLCEGKEKQVKLKQSCGSYTMLKLCDAAGKQPKNELLFGCIKKIGALFLARDQNMVVSRKRSFSKHREVSKQPKEQNKSCFCWGKDFTASFASSNRECFWITYKKFFALEKLSTSLKHMKFVVFSFIWNTVLHWLRLLFNFLNSY